MQAFYFATPERKLMYRDGREISVGVTHKHEGAVVLCESGLHAAATPFKALQYAPGPILYLVRLSGTIAQGDDKMAASERTYLAEYDATELLRRYACIQALKHIELIRPYCSERDYSAIMEYLTTGDAALREVARAAAGAAWAAAGAAVRAAAEAAWASAGAAVRAARAAAGAAVRAAAGAAEAAVRAAAGAAVRAAAGAAEAAVRAAAGAAEAAVRAARAAAGEAAKKECAAEFNTMVKTATGWEF